MAEVFQTPIGLRNDGQFWNLNVDSNGNLTFNANSLTTTGDTKMLIEDESGNVGINTTIPTEKLEVNGNIKVSGEIKVKDWTLSVADYVFQKDYQLRKLDELRSYLDRHKHLPEIPSAQEIQETGVNLSEFCMLLLKKIEELSLYVLQQDEMIQAQGERLAKLERSDGM